ncbi:MAG: hypothetical protein KGN34_02115 [Sphingomonadales bacterium]|nr:hypothetical protein [Sphingomonadales bacterium]
MRNSRLLSAVGFAALSVGIAGSAHATGTTAGATITNTVSVNYTVASVAQTAQTASNTITVDRKVVLTMTTAGTTTSVAPGALAQVTTYTVTNSSNDTIDVGLAATNQTSGATAQHGGTDAFDVSNFKYYVDTNGNGTYDAGTDTQITYLDELAADATKTVFVVSDIPAGATNTQVSGIILTATAEAGGTAATEGAVLTNTVGANTAGVDTVLADAAGTGGDVAGDGKYSVKGDYTVAGAVLSVNKYSTIISDPVNGTTNPKAIPGAVIEYCIAVANGAGAATATGLSISDTLPTTVTYSLNTIFVNATVSGTTCSAGTAGGTYTATPTPTVTGTLSNLAAGTSSGLRFRVTIN